jgi:hypothetical protein
VPYASARQVTRACTLPELILLTRPRDLVCQVPPVLTVPEDDELCMNRVSRGKNAKSRRVHVRSEIF